MPEPTKIMFHYSQRRAFANIIKTSPLGKYAATCGTNKTILNKGQGAVKNSLKKSEIREKRVSDTFLPVAGKIWDFGGLEDALT